VGSEAPKRVSPRGQEPLFGGRQRLQMGRLFGVTMGLLGRAVLEAGAQGWASRKRVTLQTFPFSCLLQREHGTDDSRKNARNQHEGWDLCLVLWT
jgi:hypothetical protein